MRLLCLVLAPFRTLNGAFVYDKGRIRGKEIYYELKAIFWNRFPCLVIADVRKWNDKE